MGDLVNLRMVRKAKRRAEESRVADANRAAFGQSKAGRTLADFTKARGDKHLDDHRLTPRSEDDRPAG